MGWFKSLVSDGAAKVVDSIAGGLDSLFTSDEERLKAKAVIEKQLQDYQVKILEAQAQHDAEITKRWQSDNEHAVTRLVRPIAFIYVLFMFTVIALFDGNIGGFAINPQYIPVFEGLLYTMVVAYFGSRGIEKVTKTVKDPKKQRWE